MDVGAAQRSPKTGYLYSSEAQFSLFERKDPRAHMKPDRRFSIKHHGRNPAGSAVPAISGPQLNRLLSAIETERDNLSRADSLLECLEIAMEYGEMTHKGPYYPDVAQIAREIVRKSIRALDPINLPSPSRDKVREDFSGTDCAPPAAMFHDVPRLPRPVFPAIPWRCSLRTHFRNYSRPAARNASRRDSACANISG